jgi:hypothetical protein
MCTGALMFSNTSGKSNNVFVLFHKKDSLPKHTVFVKEMLCVFLGIRAKM